MQPAPKLTSSKHAQDMVGGNIDPMMRRSVDVAGFWELMHEALDAADAACPRNGAGAAPLLTAAVL